VTHTADHPIAASDAVMASPLDRCELNGKAASADDLRSLALLNYGHFTSMLISDGRVRGLDLHLGRLDAATHELFGSSLDTTLVRGYMRHALDGRAGDCAMRVTIFSRGMGRDRLTERSAPDVLTTIGPVRPSGTTPLRLKSFHHERTLPRIKHVGTFPLLHYRRLAQLESVDDALFVTGDGAISEASVWNIGFVDRDSVVWPDAPALPGISMQLLQAGLGARGIATRSQRVTLADLSRVRAAFLTNSSCCVRPIASIDGIALAIDQAFMTLLEESYASNPWQAI
jgi:branched-subunit amino acid aminotransferase/4-amino-4-deoxychorismate lyase